MPVYPSPGVYVAEYPTSLPAVTEVESAVPAFVGYTEKAQQHTAHDLILKPTLIRSMEEFEQLFGLPHAAPLAISVTDLPGSGFAVTDCVEPKLSYLLHYSLRMFFENGGRQCYVVAVGTYQAKPAISLRGRNRTSAPVGIRHGLRDGLDALAGTDGPTLIVIPEAACLAAGAYATLVRAILLQCHQRGDRFAILDVHGGAGMLRGTDLDQARDHFGQNHLRDGAAYYPFLKTTLNHYVNDGASNVRVTHGNDTMTLGGLASKDQAMHDRVREALMSCYVTLPPSGAVAGVYAATDALRGVWKAPATAALARVSAPVVTVDALGQETFNQDPAQDRSINVLRAFPGKGTLVWGARTLGGNNEEWRYIPVRRLCIQVRKSVLNSLQWAVFEPNDAKAWGRARAMIEAYLTRKWQAGALMGIKPQEAFFVHCGQGTTMTALEVAAGDMVINIGMAALRPAEFIVLKITLKTAGTAEPD